MLNSEYLYNNTFNLQVDITLEEAGFLTGRFILVVGFTATCLGVTAGVEVDETDTEVEEDAGGFPAVEVVITGEELTNTGSVEGIGLPSLVCSFTTFHG